MTSILVVDDDLELSETLARDLRAQGFEVHTANSVNDAVSALKKRNIDVLLTDLRIHSERDGIELLKQTSQVSSQTRSVMMSAFATAQDYQAATQQGVVKVLWKPFSNEDLLVAIQEAVESKTGFRGNIHGLSLIDLLQMMHFARRSVAIAVRGPTSGQIFLQDGQIIDAESGGLAGEEALRTILANPSGAIHTSVLAPRPRRINRDFEGLLLDALRQIDEKGAESESSFDIAFPVSSRRPSLLPAPAAQASEFSSSPPMVARSVPPPPMSTRGAVRPPSLTNASVPSLAALAQSLASPAPPADVPQRSQRMSKIDDACRDVVHKVDGAVACAVVDLETGMLHGLYNTANFSPELDEHLARATMDIFRGPTVTRSERMIRAHRGLPEEGGERYFQEIHIASINNYHFAKTVKKGKAAIMLVTKKTTNVGMGWAMLRSVIPLVEPHIP
ncbi:MAG TPA: response regulator [Polyangiaceae bacterium]|nr:response regulator [Polyangiaceae bacterium]